MRTRIGLVCAAIVAALALAAPSFGAYPRPVLVQADLDIVKHGPRPTWKLDYLLCYSGSGIVEADVAEFRYLQGAKFRTLQVQTRGERRLPNPSERGTGACSWYHSLAYRSKFPQRIGYVNGVTLQISSGGYTSTRTFRIHP
jgi:hypothetical protein